MSRLLAIPRAIRCRLSFKLLLLAGIVLLALGAAYASLLIVQQQNALSRVSRYNLTWDASQTLGELLRLEVAVAAYAVPGGNSTKEQVQLRWQIVANRAELLRTGEIGAILERDPDLKDAVGQFGRAVARTQTLLADIDRPGTVRDILGQLSPLNPLMTRVASFANALSGDRVAEDQSSLSRSHWGLSGVLGGLIVCAIGLVLILLRHNDLLDRARASLHTLANDLDAASRELADANMAIGEANAELRQQNLALEQRDRELQLQNHRFGAALDNMSQGLCVVDADARVVVCNRRLNELFGFQDQPISAGDLLSDVLRCTPRDRLDPLWLFSSIAARQFQLERQRSAGEFFRESEDGRALSVVHRPMPHGGWIATYEDITERRRAEARIQHMALHDALTNLPNRVLMRERLDSALRSLGETSLGLAVLLIDLDHFKDINDTLGHPAGDAMLEIVGHRLRSISRRQDLVARLGGDEFAILQFGVAAPVDCANLAERVLDALQTPLDLDGQRVAISASIGIAMSPDHGRDPDQLMKSADMALYSAKARNRAIYCFFDPDMAVDLQQRRVLGLELREALARQDFEVFYQPLVCLLTDRPCGFEALIRWRHPERGLILPGRFIPLAEEMGLIGTLGEWTLQQACRDCASWPDDLRVAVNLSAHQFAGGDVVGIVERALGMAGLLPTRLELEITESVLLQENDANLAALFALRALGVRIALDDFGTGYSSLSYLRRFPFDKVKVDRSFVQGMESDPDALAIVQSIADLAPKLGMRTTAEGIETARELTRVRAAGCSEGQGYYFGRPMCGADVLPFLSTPGVPCAAPVSGDRQLPAPQYGPLRKSAGVTQHAPHDDAYTAPIVVA